MGKHTRRSSGGQDTDSANRANAPPRARPSFWRRRGVWLCTVATTVLATVLATIVNGALPHAVRLAEGLFSSPSPPAVALPSPKAPRVSAPEKHPRGGALHT